jgi:hypothetical protein
MRYTIDIKLFNHMTGSISINKRDAVLFVALLFLCLLSKGMVLLPGYSFDDYWFSQNINSSHQELFFGQGRFIAWLIIYALDLIGVSPPDISLLMGFLALILQSALAVSAIRFIGYSSLVSAGIAGAAIVLHPFSAELLTFRVALPIYCASSFFLLLSIEAMNASRGTRSLGPVLMAFVFASIAIMTYQTAFNYLLVVSVIGVFASFCSEGKCISRALKLRVKSYAFLISSLGAGVMSYVASTLARNFKIVASMPNRLSFLSSSQSLGRLRDAFGTLQATYITGTPIVPKLLTLASIVVLITCLFIILRRFASVLRLQNATLLGISLILSIPLLTIGVILVLKVWWPAPRVLAHYSYIYGLIVLISLDHCGLRASANLYKTILAISIVVLFGYAAMNNQIFADQSKLNSWDRQFANRLMMRIESHADAGRIRFVRIIGGRPAAQYHPQFLRTTYMDLNVSAFYPSVSKDWVLDVTVGSLVRGRPDQISANDGDVCVESLKWPRPESIRVIEDTAFVCLAK